MSFDPRSADICQPDYSNAPCRYSRSTTYHRSGNINNELKGRYVRLWNQDGTPVIFAGRPAEGTVVYADADSIGFREMQNQDGGGPLHSFDTTDVLFEVTNKPRQAVSKTRLEELMEEKNRSLDDDSVTRS